LFFMKFTITLDFPTTSSFSLLTLILTGSDMDLLQVLSTVTKCLSCHDYNQLWNNYKLWQQQPLRRATNIIINNTFATRIQNSVTANDNTFVDNTNFSSTPPIANGLPDHGTPCTTNTVIIFLQQQLYYLWSNKTKQQVMK
jgi:hypothetical protein